mgnify:CR=1 FL=1
MVPLFLLASFLIACMAASASEPLAVFREQEVLELDWPRTMVTYRIDGRRTEDGGQKPEVRGQRSEVRGQGGDGGGWVGLRRAARADAVQLLDEEGNEVPFQLWKVKTNADGTMKSARLSFFAELEAGGVYEYQLVEGQPSGGEGGTHVSRDGDFTRLSNGRVALRMPPVGEHSFDEPLRFGKSHRRMLQLYGRQAENEIAPGPLQGLRIEDGRWVGGSYFWAEDPAKAPKVSACTCRILRQGPVFADVRVRYRFTNGGWYQMTARLRAGEAWIGIDEQFDMGRTGNGYRWRLVVSLTSGWQENGWRPDHAFWISPQGRVEGRDEGFRNMLADAGYDVESHKGRSFGSRSLSYEKPQEKVFDVAGWYPWHPAAHYFGLVNAGQIGRKEPASFVGVVPIHAGTWRSAHRAQRHTMLFAHEGDDVDLHWPLLPQPHPNTLLHTGEYDPGVPLSYVRRQWALFGGPLQFHGDLFRFRRYEGYVNLDDYKDWVLDWETEEPVEYPRLIFGADYVEELRKKLDDHPAEDWLRNLLYFTEDPDRREHLWKRLTGRSQWQGPKGQARQAMRPRRDDTPWQSSFRQSQMAGNWAPQVDELLSSRGLSADRRRTMRRYVAAVCHALAEPDFNPRGSMVHLGNPNMPINRTLALAFAAALIPNHPQAREWMDMVGDFERYKAAMNVAPLGAWSELISYFTASAPHIMQAGMVLGQANRLDDSTAALCTLPARFTLQLLSPVDPRFGTRYIPAWGHKGVKFGAHWLVAAALLRDRNPDLARALAWAWNEVGQPQKSHHSGSFGRWATMHADLLDQVEEDYIPEQFKSQWLPGVGAVMRAHAGHPDETYLSLRQGYLASHSDANQGDFILYARGAPLIPKSLKAYALHQLEHYKKLYNEFGWHNRVRFGSKSNTGGWPGGGPASNVHRFYSSPGVDYLRGKGDYGPQRWTRQVMFVKGKTGASPNYFVLRDSFSARESEEKLQKKWWYLRTLGSRDRVRATDQSLEYTSPYGPRLNVRFIDPGSIEAESRDVKGEGPLYFEAARNWREVRDMEPHHKATCSETITVTAVGPVKAGQDIVSVLYPRHEDEPRPKYSRLDDGVVRIETRSSTDYVFLSSDPLKYEDDEMSFEGTCGMVRVYPEAVELIVAEGSGVVSYRGTTLVAEQPARRLINRAELKGQTVEVPAPGHDIAFVPPANAGAERVDGGVTRYEMEEGFAYEFNAQQPIEWTKGGVHFVGRRGGIVVGENGKVRMVMEDGESINYKGLKSWGAGGPYDLTFHRNRITGRTAGQGRFLFLTRPSDLDRLPTLVIDDQTYAPGTSGDTLIIPVLEGAHEMEIRALRQPPVVRNWPELH